MGTDVSFTAPAGAAPSSRRRARSHSTPAVLPAPPARATLDTADDRTLVGRAVDGDTRAFAVLLTRYGPVMTAYARKILGRSDEVDDVVQDAFIVAWERLADLHNPVGIRSWLLGIVSHKALDRIRRRHDHDDLDTTDHTDPVAGPEHTTMSHSRDAALTVILNSLPDQQRQCWVLKSIGGHSYDEISAELNLPISTVRGLLARARVTVTRQMEGWR